MLFQKNNCSWMIVGLGNPGSEYERTRHNAGFRTVELLAQRAGVKIDRAKFRALLRPAELGGSRVVLVKPQTYMNLSGEAVFLAGQFYKIPPERIVLIFDDVSLPFGRVRVRADGSAGGHNGVKSVLAQLGTDRIPRVKIGVGEKPHPDMELADWVLSRFTRQEEQELPTVLARAADAVAELIANGVQSAAGKYNGKT